MDGQILNARFVKGRLVILEIIYLLQYHVKIVG